ncbi:MAG: 3'-5' exonuclease [Cyclobacteriaceae bacterium]|nr:3'-5' exonuclease [Cyclobacteriaceae bacterium]
MGIFKSSEPKDWPKYLVDYMHLHARKIPGNTSIEQLNFVVLDIESTGIAKSDHILSIGGVGVNNYTIHIHDLLDVTVKHDNLKMNQSTAIHGLMPHEIEQGDLPETALKKVITFLSDRIIVGHHISFDLQLLNNMAGSLYKGLKIVNSSLDISLLFKRLQYFSSPYPVDPGMMTLEAICSHFGIEVTDRHTACGDSFITALAFLKLTAWAKKRGITCYSDLVKR